MDKSENKKTITLKQVGDDVLGGLITGAGVGAGAVAMKMGSGKVNPYLVSGLGFLFGFGTRVLANYIDNTTIRNSVKDFGNGIIAAASLDGGMKVLKKFNLLPDSVSNQLPTLSGREESRAIPGFYGFDYKSASDLLNGPGASTYSPAQVVSSQLLS